MKIKNSVSIIVNSIYAIILLLFFMDLYSCVEIKSSTLKQFAYEGMLMGTPIVLICNALMLPKKLKAVGIAVPLVIIVHLMVNNPLAILFNSASWQTQTIEYKSNYGNKHIEYQIQNRGGCGYSMRTVEVRYITPWFMIIGYPEDRPENNPEWTKVNIEVNELGLKYP